MSSYTFTRSYVPQDLTFLTASSSINATTSLGVKLGGVEYFRVVSTGVSLRNGTLMGTLREVDSGGNFLAGGTGLSSANGSFVTAYGNIHATNPGRLILQSGTASGLMIFEMGLASGAFRFRNTGGTNLLDVSDAQFYTNVATGGDYSIRINSSQVMNLSAAGLQLPSLTDAAAGTNRWYYSTTQSKACYKDAGGVSNALY